MRRMVTDKEIENLANSLPKSVLVVIDEEGSWDEPTADYIGQLLVVVEEEGDFVGLYVWTGVTWATIIEL